MNSLKRVTIIFGLIAGISYFLIFLLLYFLIDNPLRDKIAPIGLQFILLVYGIWVYKKRKDGYLHFYEGMTIGLISNFIAALLAGLLIWVFLITIDIKPFEVWITESVNFLLEDRPEKKDIMSDETFDRMIKSIRESKPHTIIWDRLMAAIWLVFPIGLFVMVLRKVRPSDP